MTFSIVNCASKCHAHFLLGKLKIKPFQRAIKYDIEREIMIQSDRKDTCSTVTETLCIAGKYICGFTIDFRQI